MGGGRRGCVESSFSVNEDEFENCVDGESGQGIELLYT